MRTPLLALVAGLVVLPLVVVTAGQPAVAAVPGEGVLTLEKTVQGAAGTPTYGPGSTFSYALRVSCSNLDGPGCGDATVVDQLPEPLVVDPAGTNQVQVTGVGTSFTVTAPPGGSEVSVRVTQPLGGGEVGLESGDEVLVLIRVQVPPDASSQYAGTVVNTGRVTQSNGQPRSASTPVVLDIEENLVATVAKSVSAPGGTPVPAVPGEEVAWTVRAGNASNGPVDAVVLQDPADGAPDPYEYLALTGFTTFDAPTGADRVRIDHRTSGGAWVNGTAVALPTDPVDALPADLSTVHGLRFTFTSSTGRIPVSGDAGRATVAYRTETRPNVTSITPGTTEQVVNRASALVTSADADSPVVTAQAQVGVRRQPPTVALTKDFSAVTVTSGGSTTATLLATVGSTPVTSLVIDEAGTGADLQAQGLTFGGFTGGLAWPEGATGAAITYRYADGVPEPAQTTTTADTLPGPTSGRRVVGFVVEFTATAPGTIRSGAEAEVPFTVTADAVSTPADVTSTNTATAQVTAADGETSPVVPATDDLTRRPLRIGASVGKNIARDWVYAVPGASSLVSLPARVQETGPVAATVGSEYLQVTDPAAPAAAPTPFWDRFDLRSVGPTEVPTGVTLTVQYWDGATWTPFAGATGVTGPAAAFTFTPSSAERAATQGVRFTYERTDPAELLPPGFQAIPYLRVELRSTLRSDPGTSAIPTVDTDLTNTVEAETHNPDAVTPTVTADAQDVVQLRPVPPGGGVDLVDKSWLVPSGATGTEIVALTDDQRTARLSWSTQNLPMDRVVLTDPSTPPGSVAASVYDTFDLVRIAPIVDPLMTFDAVDRVELWSAAAAGWVDITGAACPATTCDGGFGGYTLTASQRADTLGVRISFVESPTRASRITGPDDPDVGSGVAQSGGNDRPVDLVWQLRQERRSDGNPVLGDVQGPPLYNGTVRGEVVNTVALVGTRGATTYTAGDQDDIQVVDRPVNIDLTKTFDQATLGLPPATTAPGDYPLATATMVATNDSASKLRLLEIEDAVNPADPFEVLDLHQIEITAPPGATDVEVFLTDGAGVPAVFTEAAAEALTPAELADVTHISVQALGLMATGERLSVVLTVQLRATQRTSGTPLSDSDQVTNTARATGLNAGDTQVTDATDTIDIAEPTYDVAATKTISPATRNETQARTGYTVTVTGQTSGTVRTRLMTLTDATPTFWNAFDLSTFPAQTVPDPVQQMRLDVLTGVTYELDTTGPDDRLVARCAGSADLSACWTDGSWVTLTGGSWTPVLPAGVASADVRGLRVSARRADGSNWERPATPTVPFRFTAARRELLRFGDGGATDTPVPTTRPDLDPAPGETARGTFTDTADVHADGAWQNQSTLWVADDDATATTRFTHLTNKLSVSKAPGNGAGATPQYAPATPIPYVMTIENTGTWPQTGLTISDDIGSNERGSFLVWPADPDTGLPDPSYSFTLTGSGGVPKSTAGFTATLDVPNGSLNVGVPAGFVLAPGDTLVLRADLVFQLGLEPGTGVVNVVNVDNDRILDTCRSTRNNRPAGEVGPSAGCSAETIVEPSALSPIRAVKSVRGVGAGVPGAAQSSGSYNDLGVIQLGFGGTSSACDAPNARNGFYRYPCAPITRAGGIDRWQMSLTNAGNIPVARLAAIDVLPAPGDTGTILNTDRLSAWRAILLGNVRSNVDEVDSRDKALRVYYSTTVPAVGCNAADIRDEVIRAGLPATDPCYADVNARAWSLLTPATPGPALAAARAIKVVIDYDEVDSLAGLAPGDTIDVTFDTQTPAYAPRAVDADRDPIAYNSFAVASLGTFQGDDAISSVVEPRKVGVAMSTGRLDLLKEVATPAGTAFPLPASYPFDLSCTSQGETVPLTDVDGNDVSRVRLTPGEVLTVNGGGTGPWSRVNIPRYATCSLTEVTSQGATVTFDPVGADPDTSDTVVAVRDYSTRLDIANPAFPSPVPLAQITATNTYAVAGFDVTKTVDNGGAVEEDGDPVVYDETYTFTASCTFNGTQVVPAADRTFTLTDGQTKSFDDLPAGADCTVVETGTGTSATRSHTVTEDGTTAPASPGATATLTLGADVGGSHVNAVELTNTYTVGRLEVTKEVLGLGADWSGNEFRIIVACTLDSAASNPVYSTSRLVDQADPRWEIDNLPTGAECTVTEDPDEDGGATLTLVLPEEPVTITTTADPTEVEVVNGFGAGDVRVTKRVEGDTAELPTSLTGTYTVELSCTFRVNGEDIVLDLPGGPRRTITGDGGTALWAGLPTGAECEATEVGSDPVSQGTTITPALVTVGINDTADFTVTNTFSFGSVRVTKDVTGPGAELYGAGPFQVRLACTVADGSGTTPVDIPGGATRTLSASTGLATRYELLPVGAACTVSEPDPAGASSTRMTVTRAGAAPVTTAGRSADLVVVDDAASGPSSSGEPAVQVAVDNRYDVGGLRVVKEVTGAGAERWSPGRFEVDLSCQDPAGLPGGAGLAIPGGSVRELTAAGDFTTTYDDLPPGAACTLTETTTGGATETEVRVSTGGDVGTVVPGSAAPVVIGNDTAADDAAAAATVARITNRYGVGTVRVVKELTGPGADDAAGPFTVVLTCTRVVDGTRVPVDVPDGERDLVRPDGLRTRWNGLPLGASCEVDEPGDGGADTVTITPRSVTVGAEPVTLTVRNHFRKPASAGDTGSHGPADPATGDGNGNGNGNGDQTASDDDGLPGTGSAVSPWVVWLGGALVALGIGLLVLSRLGPRRRSTS